MATVSQRTFGQMAPLGTGSFDVALDTDIVKDATVDHRLPVQIMPAAELMAE